MVMQLLVTLGGILVQEAALTTRNSLLVHCVADEQLLDDAREIERILKQSNLILEVDQDNHSDDESDSESKDEQDDSRDHRGPTSSPILNMAPNIDHCVTCLMNLLPAMESLVECHVPAENSRPDTLDVSSMAFSYIHNIRDKFPLCSVALSERLGEANWQRYLRINKRMSNEPTEIESSTHGSIFTPVSLFHDSGYATTNVSTSSFLTTKTQVGTQSFRVPETPSEVSDGILFICFICGRKSNQIRNRIDWKVHVFADLRPYLCTVSNCEMASNLFPTRRTWAQHEFSKHRDRKGMIECPFCQKTFVSDHHGFSSHVARHIETISLAALPSSEEPAIEVTESDQELQTASEHASTWQRPIPESEAGSNREADTRTEASPSSTYFSPPERTETRGSGGKGNCETTYSRLWFCPNCTGYMGLNEYDTACPECGSSRPYDVEWSYFLDPKK
ncbi:hypothetical protein BJ875DRAFT_494380 [Amylocarpus encephaloides]|uniref:C2H2-type domain-containing protein n=1 Tax=Amylocarpus encephaloides TaxID=45428 RepID=A0A9P7YM88_9HELO|nr:hypothetical protein BJ875DRAFT_494380 [Amylocarpus encephaloides]